MLLVCLHTQIPYLCTPPIQPSCASPRAQQPGMQSGVTRREPSACALGIPHAGLLLPSVQLNVLCFWSCKAGLYVSIHKMFGHYISYSPLGVFQMMQIFFCSRKVPVTDWSLLIALGVGLWVKPRWESGCEICDVTQEDQMEVLLLARTGQYGILCFGSWALKYSNFRFIEK